MVSNNQYYKAIAELLNEEEYTGEHNDGYYLKRIVEHYGVSYSKVKCKGKYLKDWARAILGTVTGSHANNYYLKNIAEALTSVEYSWRSENSYLKIILDNIADISKVTTKLLWGTPPTNLVYGDEFNATVILTEDSSNNPIPDATVEMICGSTTIGTGTTDSNGVATVTAIPMSAGSHRFYFKYNGSVNYSGSFSSEETISVGKETCILNVTSPSDYTSIYTDSSVTVTGTLTENDTGYPPMENVEINYSIVTDGSTVKTGRFDTDNTGAFSTTITGFTTGTTTNLILSYTGDSNYNSVSKTIPLTVSAPSLLLSSDKPILSYADSESATLTATLQSSDKVGKTIRFYNVTEDVLLGTGVTDSDGVAQCNHLYSSQGIGDVEFEASYGSLVSEIFVLEDCKYWNDGSSVGSLEIPTGASVTSNGDYLTIASTSSEKIITLPVSLSNSDEWEFSLKLALKQNNKCLGLIFNDNTYYASTNANGGKYYAHFTSDEYWETPSATGDVITIKRQSGKTSISVNGNQLTNKTVSHKSSFKCGFYTFNQPQYVDNLKIKPL